MENFKYKSAQFIRYLGDSFIYPFLALYFASIGKSEGQIGLVLMILPLSSIIINPLWSLLSKNVNYNRIFIIVFTLIESLIIVYLMTVTTIPLIILSVFLLAIVGQPFYTLFDGYTAIYSSQNNTSYSNFRLYGSLGYAIGALVAGYVTKHLGYHYAFYGAAIFFLGLSFILMWIKPLPLHLELSDPPKVKSLLKNRKYLKFTAFYVISMALLFGGDAFLGVYFKYRGYQTDFYGMVMFLGVIGEVVVLLLLSKWGYKLKTKTIMLSIITANFIRFLTFSFETHQVLLIVAYAIRPITMGGLLFLGVEYMNNHVKKNNMTLGIVIYGSLRSFIQAIYTFGGGYFIESFGYYMLYFVTALLTLTALFFVDYRQDHDIISKEG